MRISSDSTVLASASHPCVGRNRSSRAYTPSSTVTFIAHCDCQSTRSTPYSLNAGGTNRSGMSWALPVASKYTRWPSHSPDAAARKSASVSAVATDAARSDDVRRVGTSGGVPVPMMLADDRDGARGCRGCDAARAGGGVRRVERGGSVRRRHLKRRGRSSRRGGGRLRWASTVSDGSGELIIDLIFFFSVGDDPMFPASRCPVSVVRGWSGFDTRAAAEASLRLRSRAR